MHPVHGAAVVARPARPRRDRDRRHVAGATAQRTPINTEAKYLLLSHAFEQWDVWRVAICTDEDNARSRDRDRAYRRHVRGHPAQPSPALQHRPQPSRRDTAVYSITDADWPSVKRSPRTAPPDIADEGPARGGAPVPRQLQPRLRRGRRRGLDRAPGHAVDTIDLYAIELPGCDVARGTRRLRVGPPDPRPDGRRPCRRWLHAAPRRSCSSTRRGGAGLPAVLKGWLERVMVPGVGFTLDERRARCARPDATSGASSASAPTARRGRYVKLTNDNGRRILTRALRMSCGWRTRTTWLALYAIDTADADRAARPPRARSRHDWRRCDASARRLLPPRPGVVHGRRRATAPSAALRGSRARRARSPTSTPTVSTRRCRATNAARTRSPASRPTCSATPTTCGGRRRSCSSTRRGGAASRRCSRAGSTGCGSPAWRGNSRRRRRRAAAAAQRPPHRRRHRTRIVEARQRARGRGRQAHGDALDAGDVLASHAYDVVCDLRPRHTPRTAARERFLAKVERTMSRL